MPVAPAAVSAACPRVHPTSTSEHHACLFGSGSGAPTCGVSDSVDVFFFWLAGCIESRGFWQSLTKRESVKATPEVLRFEKKSSAQSTLTSIFIFFLARCCLGQVPGGAPFSQPSELATACTNRMQIKN